MTVGAGRGVGAVADRLLVDLAADGKVSVSTWLDGELPGGPAGKPRKLAWPLDADALEELRWYLEDYLRAPFGVYESRGPKTQAQLQPWGEAVFGAVFGSGPARDAYQRMRARGAGLQVVFRSGSAQSLALPWELMRDPAGGLPLALDVAGIDRSLPTAQLGAAFEAAGGRLRVLMVISRPAGAADIGFQMIARPLLARLDAVRGNVDLVVLRPPTLDALATVLAEAAAAKKPFQVVHFDGHGALAGRGTAGGDAAGMYEGAPEPEGVLIFQDAQGGRDPVPASRVAQVLAAAQVPVVILNACQSGAIGKQLEAAVATRLLQGGAGSVVAMAYSVYAVAAAEFMAAFYERLFAGDTVSTAVTAGRQRLYSHAGRPSPKGKLPLADWLVPVHYLRREVSFPGLVTARPEGEPSLEEELNRLRNPAQGEGSEVLAPVDGVFTGRDALFFELETAARLQHVIVLSGPAGTGKTELAKAFGRWWQDTGGVERPGWVFWHSFEPGLASFGLDGVITEIGLALFGPDFARVDDTERAGVVEGFLRDRRALLIWDNFESVRTLPDPTAATPRLDDTECQQLQGFLHRLAAGARSAMLITSRTTETWLDETGLPGTAVGPSSGASPGRLRRIQVPGLLPAEAADYADDLLAPYPAAAPRRAGRAFGELMQWLDGHPLSMRLILPHLDTTDPRALLAGLQGTAPLPGWDDGQGARVTSLPASLSYSYAHLDPATQRLLVAVCLFQGVADADVLALMSDLDGVPERFQGVSTETWGSVLDAAAGAGLLTGLGAGMYRIHPALPAYLAARWRAEENVGYDGQRAAAIRALLSAYAAFSAWLIRQIDSGGAGLAYTIIDLQQRTMGRLLGYALEEQLWAEAEAIVDPLDKYWGVRGRWPESDAWVDRVRLTVENLDGTVPELDSPPGSLWASVMTAQAARQVNTGRWEEAERTYREMMTMIEAQPASLERQNVLGLVYFHYGRIAQDHGRLAEAADWYGRALDIYQETGDRRRTSYAYHQLGRVAQDQGQSEEATDWFNKALAIEEERNDQPWMALTYHGLGITAYRQGRPEQAADWFNKALAIEEELGNRSGMSRMYHQLGIVAHERGRLDEAENWYTRSLAISEELGDRPGTAASYHQLGNVAHERGRLDEAEDWYTRSLAISEELGNRPYLAITYSQLGKLTEERGSPGQALEWTVRCVALFDDVPHPGSGTGPGQLAQLTHQLGIEALEACWQRVTGDALPDTVREFARSYRPETGDTAERGDQ